MNYPQIITASVLAASLCAPHVSSADDDTGFFVGVAVNRLSADFEDERDVDFDDSDTAASVRAGYMFNNFIGLEVGYLDLGDYFAEGDSRSNRIELDADAITLAAVFNWTVNDQLDLYAKAGAVQLNVDSDSVIAGARLQRNDDETEAFGSFGVEYDLGNLNLFAEFSIADTDINDLTIDLATAGIKYEFGK